VRRFIHRENIRHFQRLLRHSPDENERRRILGLLEEEVRGDARAEARASRENLLEWAEDASARAMGPKPPAI